MLTGPAAAAATGEAMRAQIAGELHDCAIQLLLRAHNDLHAPAADRDAVARARVMLDSAIAELRRISSGEPEPGVAAHGGLEAALRTLCRGASGRAKLDARVEIDPAATGGPHDDLLYVLAREFVENAVKHASATRIDLLLNADEAGFIELVVRDDGRGMHAGERARPGHIGLDLARNRVSGAGGTISVASGAAIGTTMTVRIERGPARRAA